MRLLYLFLLPMLFCTCALGAEVSSPGDEPLNKPVTLAVKGEALSDIMAMLSKQTGLKLRAAKEVADQKATAFVDRRQLRYVLDGLCTIFGYRWSVVKQTDGSRIYEIWESPKTKLAREAATTGAVAATWQEVDRRIRDVAALTPEEQESSRKELEQIEARVGERGSSTPEQQARMNELYTRLGDAVAMARLYTKFSPGIIQALQSGASVHFDTETGEAEWRVPRDVDAGLKARLSATDQRLWGSSPPGGYHIEFRGYASSNRVSLGCTCTRFLRPGNSDYGLTPQPSPDLAIVDTSPEQQVKLPSADDDGALSKQVAFTAQDLADEADLYRQTEKSSPVLVNRSDILSLLHRKLGLQSISDHNSYWFAWDAKDPQSVKYLLDHLPGMIARHAEKSLEPRGVEVTPHSNPAWGWDGTCLQMRERFPHKLDAAEPPNRVVRRLRTNLARNHYLDFDDVADAATLTTEQFGVLTGNWGRLVKARGVDYGGSDLISAGVWSAIYCSPLRFYARLTDVQKRAVRANGLPTTDLVPSHMDDLVKYLGPMLLEHPEEGDQARRHVGIYKNGIRLDKPGSMAPALIRLTRQESQLYMCMIPLDYPEEGRWTGFDGRKAQSPEDAWQQCLKDYPGLDKKPCFFGRHMGYKMLFALPDGTTKERPIELYAPVTVGK